MRREWFCQLWRRPEQLDEFARRGDPLRRLPVAIEIRDGHFAFQLRIEQIEAEARLDGIYVIRTSVPVEHPDANEAVQAYKDLSRVERAFRSLKTNPGDTASFSMRSPIQTTRSTPRGCNGSEAHSIQSTQISSSSLRPYTASPKVDPQTIGPQA